MEGEKLEDSIPAKEEPARETPKVLTEEEKAEKLRRAEERIKQRRIEIQEEERKKDIEREKNRRKDGQDLAKIKADIEWREAQKIAEQKKREKREDRLARQRVLEEIARDRANMKAKNSESVKPSSSAATSAKMDKGDERQRIKDEISRDRESMKTQQKSQKVLSTPNSSSVPMSEQKTAKRDYNEAKIQIRLPNNMKLVQTFGADEPLSAVRVYVDMHSQGQLGPYIDLSIPYPRKVFNDDEMQMSLRTLGLVPNAVVMATESKVPGSAI